MKKIEEEVKKPRTRKRAKVEEPVPQVSTSRPETIDLILSKMDGKVNNEDLEKSVSGLNANLDKVISEFNKKLDRVKFHDTMLCIVSLIISLSALLVVILK